MTPTRLPFIAISDGMLTCDRLKFNRPASEASAKALGDRLRKLGIDRWLYSSSVDHPADYDAPDLDYRALIEGV